MLAATKVKVNGSEKKGRLPFLHKTDRKKEKSVVSFMHEQSVTCSQTQLDDIAREQTIICRQLFAGHMHGGLSANEKEEIFASNDNLGPSF